jgi:hypothetical protein
MAAEVVSATRPWMAAAIWPEADTPRRTARQAEMSLVIDSGYR